MAELGVSGRTGRNQRESCNLNIFGKPLIFGIFGFLAAMASPYEGLAPFGMSFLARERRMSARSFLYMFLVCLGVSVVCERAETTKYIAAGLIYMGVLFVLERDVVIDSFVAAFISGGCVFVSGLLLVFWRGITFENLFVLICDAALTVLGTIMIEKGECILDKDMMVAEKADNDKKYSLFFVAVLVVLSLKKFSFGSMFSLMDMVAAVTVLVIARSGGTAVSTGAGVILGVSCGIDSNFFMPVVGSFAFCGLVAGVMNRFGKVGVISGLLIADAVLVVHTNGAMRTMLGLYEVMAASVVFALIPARYLEMVRKIICCCETESESVIKIKEGLKIKLKSVSGAIGDMSGTLERLAERKGDKNNGDIAAVFDVAAERVCTNCRKSVACWNKDFDFTYNSLLRMMRVMNESGEIGEYDADERFKEKCINFSKLITEMNHQQDLNRLRCIWKSKLCESRELVSEQLSGMSEIIASISEELEWNNSDGKFSESEVLKLLENNGIKVRKIEVIQENSGRYRVAITVRSGYWKDEPRREIMKIMRELFECEVGVRDMLCEKGKFVKIEFSEAERYRVETDFACKSVSDKNGDNYRFSHISEGKYVIALSDGMGTGSRAARESEAMLELLDSFLRAGFDSRMAVRFINSIMLLKSDEEAFVTIDICIIDLYTGRAEFIKTGAEASFIVHDNYVDTVKAASLPVGIVADIEASVSNRTVADGSVIIMVTDGVETRDSGGVQWVRGFIEKNCREEQNRNLAERILQSAIEKNNGEVNDDMTVLSVRLREVG